MVKDGVEEKKAFKAYQILEKEVFMLILYKMSLNQIKGSEVPIYGQKKIFLNLKKHLNIKDN